MRSSFTALLASVAAACGGPAAAVGLPPDQVVLAPGETTRIAYGDDPNQFGDLTLPRALTPERGGVPVVVLIHGGFWRTRYGSNLMEPLVPSLVDAGCAVWNIEYRRVGSGRAGGGGYPSTFDDVAAAIDVLAELPSEAASRLDLGRVATVGHSAGGHLAVWAASRSASPADSGPSDSGPSDSGPSDFGWSDPAVVPVLAVSQAGVLDLERCISEQVGGTACSDLLGGSDLENRILMTSPTALVPIRGTVVAVHGTADRIVPIDQSASYVEAASAAGGMARLVGIDGADHFAMIDPNHAAWTAVLDALAAELHPG